MGAPVRLQKYLSQAGVSARRKGEDLIVAGRVTVNGKVITELGTKVDPDVDQVTVDGEAVYPKDRFYILFNKPKGCITTVADDRGRTTVMDYLPNLPISVAPVGRLDYYTEGVLLLTNDGELAARLLAPRSGIPKTYHAKIHGRIDPLQVEQLRNGVRLDDGSVTQPAEVVELPGDSKHTWLAITLKEGKSRQVHRMLESVGHTVTKLQRVAFANLTFHGLRVGDARELGQQELNELRDLVGLDHSANTRGRWSARREETDISRRAADKAREAQELAEAEAAAELAAGDEDEGDDEVDVFTRALETARRPEPPAAGRGPRREPTSARPREDARAAPRSAPRGPAAPGVRGAPMTDNRAPSRGPRRAFGDAPRDDRGPSRGPSGPSRGPSGPSRGPGGPSRGPSGPSRGPSRSFGPRDDRGPSRGPSGPSRSFGSRDDRGPSRGPSSGPSSGPSRSFGGPSRSFGGPDRGPSRGPSSGFGGPRGGAGTDRPSGPRDDRGPSRGPSRSFGPPRGGPGSGPPRGPSRGPRSGGDFGDARGPARGAKAGFGDRRPTRDFGDAPKRGFGPRSDGPPSRGPRSDGPPSRGPRSDGPPSRGPRSADAGPPRRGPGGAGFGGPRSGPSRGGPPSRGPRRDGPSAGPPGGRRPAPKKPRTR